MPTYTPEQLFMRARLERMGVYIRILGFDDLFCPPSYILRYGSIDVTDVSWDAAVLSFIEELLKHAPVEKVIGKEPTDLEVVDPDLEDVWQGDTDFS